MKPYNQQQWTDSSYRIRMQRRGYSCSAGDKRRNGQWPLATASKNTRGERISLATLPQFKIIVVMCARQAWLSCGQHSPGPGGNLHPRRPVPLGAAWNGRPLHRSGAPRQRRSPAVALGATSPRARMGNATRKARAAQVSALVGPTTCARLPVSSAPRASIGM